jgi:ACT domain-containing protein
MSQTITSNIEELIRQNKAREAYKLLKKEILDLGTYEKFKAVIDEIKQMIHDHDPDVIDVMLQTLHRAVKLKENMNKPTRQDRAVMRHNSCQGKTIEDKARGSG